MQVHHPEGPSRDFPLPFSLSLCLPPFPLLFSSLSLLPPSPSHLPYIS
jgi:hypothetical protein